MVRPALRAALVVLALMVCARPAFADPANDALASAIAQAKPIGETERPLAAPGLPPGLAYTLDTWSAFSLGKTGSNGKLPGGWDAVVAYGLDPHLRVQAGYYQFPEYPIGFSTGVVPVYLQGTSSPIGSQNLNGSVDATIKNDILVLQVQTLIAIAKKYPVIITPTYVARWGTVGGKTDDSLILNNGFPLQVHLRTFQQQLVAFTFPFISSKKAFATYTIAPQWLVRTNGANTTNHAQLFQLLYAEYRPTKTTTVFLQPSILQNYTPVDQYPQHIPTIIVGATQKLYGPFYAQVQLSTGTPTNPPNNQIGISSLTCQQLPCAPNQVAAKINGLKASQIQLMLGFGKPAVVPL